MPRQKKQQLKKRPDGRYCARYHGMAFYGSTSDEALAAREEYKRLESAGINGRLLVGEYALRWLKLHKSNVSPRCYNDYAHQFEIMLGVIGNKTMMEVTPDDCMEVWQAFVGKSESAIHKAKMLYVALFDSGMENGFCQRNPFRSKSAKPPKGTAGGHRAITPEEVRLIETTPHRLRPAAMVMLYAGLRRGEVMALTADDIHLDTTNKTGSIHIDKAIRYESNQPITSTPKTAAGTRTVPIIAPLFPVLQEALQKCALVCPSASGEIMTEIAFKRGWDSYLHALTKAAGHPVSIRPHDLRYTYCTMLRDAGVDIKQAIIWLGHADEKMILRVYDQAGDYRAAQAVKQVEDMLSVRASKPASRRHIYRKKPHNSAISG